MTVNYDNLIGLPFKQGVTDCYYNFRAYYKQVLNITLADYARPNDWWTIEGMDLYRENYIAEGFRLVEFNSVKDIQVHDGLLITIPDPRTKGIHVPNHIAVYTGNGNILHHRYGKLSCEELYRGAMRNWTTMVIRHKDVKPEVDKPKTTRLDLMDKILPNKRALLESLLKDDKDK